MTLRIEYSQFIGTFRLPFILASLMMHPLASAEVPTGSSEKTISKKEIIKLVDQYVTAVEDENFEAWNELLTPLHTDSPLLTPTNFLTEASMIQDLSVEQIDGLNAALKIQYYDGREQIGSLQIHDSGHIKYTPFVFKHPVSRACSQVQILLNDYMTMLGSTSSEASRMEIVWELDAMGIPLCDYDPLTPFNEARRAAAKKILKWLEENGQEFDNTEPKIFITPDEFTRCIEEARSTAQ